jgi:hypothetical protein
MSLLLKTNERYGPLSVVTFRTVSPYITRPSVRPTNRTSACHFVGSSVERRTSGMSIPDDKYYGSHHLMWLRYSNH